VGARWGAVPEHEPYFGAAPMMKDALDPALEGALRAALRDLEAAISAPSPGQPTDQSVGPQGCET
jgi:hypothetical protein